jgi:lactate permease
MDIPLNALTWIMASLPIVVMLVLMIGFQWGATKAAPFGVLIAAFSGLFIYEANINMMLIETLKGFWSTLVVLLVVWPAILLFEVVSKAKAFGVIRKGLQKYTPNELIQVITLGWVFMSFLQGITGFGVPVAVGAPLLVGIGVTPIWAVLIPLIGHAWANTFGTLAVAWNALVLQTNLAADPVLLLQTAFWAASFIWVWNFITGIAICWIYGGWRALKKGFPAIIVISLIQGGGQLFLSQVNQTLAAFIPAVISLIAVFLLSKTKMYGEVWSLKDSKVMNHSLVKENEDDDRQNMGLHQAFFPYYVLTFITLFILLISPIKKLLGAISFGFSFPETSTGFGFINVAVEKFSPIAPLTNAGIFLLSASLIGFLYYQKHGWIEKNGIKSVLKSSIDKTLPSAIAVLGFIVMSRLMGGTGQTVVLARGIANTFGRSYAILAPVVGMLGAFMTSSNMASNILFGEFQLTTAKLLNLNVAAILGAQTAGGAIGNTICPGNIILGTTTAGILGMEGIVLKKVLPITLTAAIIVGVILFITQILV